MTDSKISPVGTADEVTDDHEDNGDAHEGDEATVADAVEASSGPAARTGAASTAGLVSPHRQKIALIPLVVALVFFFSPAAAFVLGDRAATIDNRPLANLPSPADGWAFFPDFNTWANDHLPLRSEAVEGGTELSEAVFDEPPPYGQTGAAAADGVQYPQVIDGEDGWLYFGGDVSAPCNPVRSIDETIANFQRLEAAIRASGRTMVLAVVPDKSTMVPEHLPDQYAGEQCASARKEAMWEGLTSAGLPLVDMRDPLAAEQEHFDEPLYRPHDSHWNRRGAGVFVEEIVGRLDPALVGGQPGQPGLPSPFVEGADVELNGDLGTMLGTPTTDPAVGVTVERPGVTVAIDGVTVDHNDIDGMERVPVTVDGSSTGAPLIPGRTALLGDSFSAGLPPLVTPFFDSLTLLHNQASAEALTQTIVDSDTIVVQIVERSVAAGEVQLATPAVVDVIEQSLAANPR